MIEWSTDALVSWRGVLVSGGVTALTRMGWWLWRRSTGDPTPFFGRLISRLFSWAAQWAVMPETIITLAIENRYLKAQNRALRRLVKRAGMEDELSRLTSDSRGGSGRLSAWPGALPSRSSKRVRKRSSATPEPPDAIPD